MPHKTRPVQVWVDADLGIADLVEYLNTIPGVRTMASCQGTIGEGGPHPYRAQVMCTWTPEAHKRLKAEFDLSYISEHDGQPTDGTWGYVHPRANAEPAAPEEPRQAVTTEEVPPVESFEACPEHRPFIPRWGMSFPCGLEKGHEGSHLPKSHCVRHGGYLGDRCPHWPTCVSAEEHKRRLQITAEPHPVSAEPPCKHENMSRIDWISRTGGKCPDCGDIVFRDEVSAEPEKQDKRPEPEIAKPEEHSYSYQSVRAAIDWRDKEIARLTQELAGLLKSQAQWMTDCLDARTELAGLRESREELKPALIYLASHTEGEARAFVEGMSIRLGFGHAAALANAAKFTEPKEGK